MFKFIQINYDELKQIYNSDKWMLNWLIIEEEHIKGCEKILTQNNELIGLIYYSTSPYPMIAKFEIIETKKNQGYGKAIIQQFLKKYPFCFELIPFSEENVLFWEKCSFVGNHLGMTYKYEIN